MLCAALTYPIGLSLGTRREPKHKPFNIPANKESTDSGSSDSGSVKVWRVDSSKNHTVEQLLGIDRDTLMQFNKSHTQE